MSSTSSISPCTICDVPQEHTSRGSVSTDVRAIGGATSAAALRAFCAERVADYEVPETWAIGTGPLPRNLNGKIMKRVLRQRLAPALI
ncbi:MAG: hypothetical protein LKCHEGNO_01007 [Burkholderiaceae bacterium]|nr:hypothetical protein [Burkholderiaceae bacterium]